MSTKLSKGDVMPQFTYCTPFEEKVELKDTLKRVEGKTAIIFLRYYGCTLCQLDIHEFAEEYDKVKNVNGQILVVLQSDPAKLAQQITPDTFPYDIICDPDQELYKMFDIKPAASMAELASAATMLKIAKTKVKGYTHGDYEGEELQLPAAFVVDQDGVISYAHYGTAAGDVPTPEEVVELLQA